MPFVKGQSGNPAGRPKGIIDRRARLNRALLDNADNLLSIATAKAQAGDPQMLSLLLSRVMPVLKPEGSLVRFELDTSASLPAQLEQVTRAVAAGQLTVEEGKQIAEMIERLANVRALADGESKADALIAAFKQMATSLPV